MIHRSALAPLIALFMSVGVAPAQERQSRVAWHFVDQATVPDLARDMPEHVRMLYADTVNMRDVQRAFDAFYAGRDSDAPFEDLERDPYAKFFYQWFQAARDYVDDDGIVRAMDTRQLLRHRAVTAQVPAPSSATTGVQGPASTWSFVGPERTLWRADHDASQPAAPWQVNIYCIAAAPSDPDTLYCGSETGVLYRSVDKGQNWIPYNDFNWGAAILSVAIHPTDPDTAFAATNTDIIRTTDGGGTWSIVRTESGLSCNSLAISPTSPSTMLAGTANGLLRSTDSGGTWSTVLSERVDDVEFRPGDGGTAYALTRTGSPDTYTLYKSVDSGATFMASMSGWGTLYEHSGGRLSVTPADPDYVYAILLTHDGSGNDQKPYILKSVDSAASWSTVATCNGAICPLNNGQGYYDLDIVASHTNPEHLIAATTSAYRSTDGGATWTLVGGYGGPFGIHPDIQAMISIVDGATEDTWIATDGGVNHSTDFYANTANWEPRIDGLDGTDLWGYAQGWNEDFMVGGRYHNGNTALHENYPARQALRLGGAESPTGWALHGRERFAAFDDISELILPASVDQAPEGSFLFTKHPQIYYYGDAFSRVLVDPQDFMTVYVGEGAAFWRSRDGGASWEDTHTFNGLVYHFDMSRADPDVIYATTDMGFRRSVDRGETFQGRPKPPGLTNYYAQNLRVAASSTDPDTVWVLNQRAGANSSLGRVFVSHDGAASWIDLTTPMLAGRKWTSIAHQAGTNGGIYIASRRGEAGGNPARVLYRDATMGDWVDHSAGLPYSANPIKLLPFYRDSKLRWAGNRGIWEIDFIEPNWSPMAQPFVSGGTQICLRDVVEFDSYSICTGDATYSWSIPGADWTTDLLQREVHATYPMPGTYTASLTITQGAQSDTESIEIIVQNECDADQRPGNALALSGASGDYAATSSALGITTNTLTISAWIKRDGPQEPYAGIVFMRGSTAHGLNFRNGTNIGFHWNNNQWSWNSGLTVPDGVWAHVAMVVNPTETTLYLDGRPAQNGANPPMATFDDVMNFGADPPWGARRFRGEMDEVLIHDRALSQDEIRELMHRTRRPQDDPSLIGYWQFNREQGVVTDRVATNHVSLIGGAARVLSTAPVGSGESARLDVSAPGAFVFGSTGLTLEFQAGAATLPGGEVCVTRIDHASDESPPGAVTEVYWAVHNYGTNAAFTELESLQFGPTHIPSFLPGRPNTVDLYRRNPTAHGPTWGAAVDRSDAVTGGPTGSARFDQGNGQTSFGQYVLSF
ncbi:MAG: photosystem II stability/assembly factor-like uncharacterized protein, partial [Planctomycetota bacterium]